MKKKVPRIFACLMACLVAFNLYAIPKAEASVVGSMVANMCLSAYMTATGIDFTPSEETAEQLGLALQSAVSDYVKYVGGLTSTAFNSILENGCFIQGTGLIRISQSAAVLLADFTAWIIDKYDLEIGGNSKQVVNTSNWVVDGKSINLVEEWDYQKGTVLELNKMYTTTTGNTFCFIWSSEKDESGKFRSGLYINGELVGYTMPIYSSAAIGWVFNYDDYYGKDTICVTIVREKEDGSLYGVLMSTVRSGSFTELFGDLNYNATLDVALGSDYQTLDGIDENQEIVINPGIPYVDYDSYMDAVMVGAAKNELSPTLSVDVATGGDVIAPDGDTETDSDVKGIVAWLQRIYYGILDIPKSVVDGIKSIFAVDTALIQEIAGTFNEKFGFLTTLHELGSDLLSINPSSSPPVVYIHLEDAEGSIDYGGTVKALDMSWYARYKEDGDRIMSGFLWIGFLWLLFKRAPAIINGAEMATDYSIDIHEGGRRGKRK